MNTILNLNLSEWITGSGGLLIIGLIIGFLRKKGVNYKTFMRKAATISKEVGEAFLETSTVFSEAADLKIKNDENLDENSVKEVIAAGKKAVIEWKDVVMVIKPKK